MNLSLMANSPGKINPVLSFYLNSLQTQFQEVLIVWQMHVCCMAHEKVLGTWAESRNYRRGCASAKSVSMGYVYKTTGI